MVLASAQNGRIVDVNLEWVALTGFTRAEVLGRTALEFGHWPGSLESLEALMAPLKTCGRLRDVDVTLVMKDHTARLVRLSASLIVIADDPMISMCLRDVTHERLAQEALLAGERVLERTNEAHSRVTMPSFRRISM